jgi:hypothetical protein
MTIVPIGMANASSADAIWLIVLRKKYHITIISTVQFSFDHYKCNLENLKLESYSVLRTIMLASRPSDRKLRTCTRCKGSEEMASATHPITRNLPTRARFRKLGFPISSLSFGHVL